MNPDDLRELLAIEEEDCRRTLKLIADLQARVKSGAPDVHEIAAFGAYLHGLYGGIESTFKHLSRYLNIPVPGGENWHLQLIETFAREVHGLSQPLIPAVLKQQLHEYRGFRHIFRVHYAMELDWNKMVPLIAMADTVLLGFYQRVRTIVLSEALGSGKKGGRMAPKNRNKKKKRR